MSAVTTPAHGRMRVFLGSNRGREAIEAYILILPTIIGLIIFTASPVLASLYYSFTRWSLLSTPKWQGFDNYIELFTNDPLFWVTIKNTAYYVLGTVPTGTVLALGLAIALNQKIRLVAVFRTIYFLPVVSSVVAISVLWLWLYQSDFGLVNEVLRFFGFRGVRWLSSVTWAMPAIMIMSIWHGLGYNIVIFIAGLQGIPQDYYEAATVDGANAWHKFTYITIPAAVARHLLRPHAVGYHLLPGLRPGLCDDAKAGRSTPRRRSSTISSSRGLRTSTWGTPPRWPMCSSLSSLD